MKVRTRTAVLGKSGTQGTLSLRVGTERGRCKHRLGATAHEFLNNCRKAHMDEHPTDNRKVLGSNPRAATKLEEDAWFETSRPPSGGRSLTGIKRLYLLNRFLPRW